MTKQASAETAYASQQMCRLEEDMLLNAGLWRALTTGGEPGSAQSPQMKMGTCVPCCLPSAHPARPAASAPCLLCTLPAISKKC